MNDVSDSLRQEPSGKIKKDLKDAPFRIDRFPNRRLDQGFPEKQKLGRLIVFCPNPLDSQKKNKQAPRIIVIQGRFENERKGDKCRCLFIEYRYIKYRFVLTQSGSGMNPTELRRIGSVIIVIQDGACVGIRNSEAVMEDHPIVTNGAAD